ncbi:hypothetical protein J2754_002776 [Halarchaeum solikamskense]|nr:hypothetical protein [Halarchaeum solikamskense]
MDASAEELKAIEERTLRDGVLGVTVRERDE